MRILRLLSRSKLALVLTTSAALVGGFLLATSVFGGSLPSGLQFPRPVDLSPSTYLKLRPGDPGFAEFPSEFAEFPLYWVGEEFGGHSLRYIIRQVFSSGDVGPTQNNVKFLYGSCGAEKLTEGGCPPPLQIIVEPYCLVPPERLTQAPDLSPTRKVRGGADAVTVGGGLRIWTDDVTIKIYASSPQLLADATAALVSSNGLGATGAGSPLPAPDPDCSGYEMVPHPGGPGG